MSPFQKIYLETLNKEVDLKGGYLVSYRPLSGKSSYLSINTMWVGQDGEKEIRQPGMVDLIKTKSRFELLRYPILTVTNASELTSFLHIGGHAIIGEDVIETNWENILHPKIVIETENRGYLDYETIEKRYKRRFATGNYRIEIFERDNYRCKICGSCPDDNIHVRLEVHHIKPWREGGISTPDNLITLCASCHDGATAINRFVLYDKIGLYFPTAEYEIFRQNDKWSDEQRHIYKYFLSNTVSFKIDNN